MKRKKNLSGEHITARPVFTRHCAWPVTALGIKAEVGRRDGTWRQFVRSLAGTENILLRKATQVSCFQITTGNVCSGTSKVMRRANTSNNMSSSHRRAFSIQKETSLTRYAAEARSDRNSPSNWVKGWSPTGKGLDRNWSSTEAELQQNKGSANEERGDTPGLLPLLRGYFFNSPFPYFSIYLQCYK